MADQLAGNGFGAVHIIQSLPKGELETGRRLFDELQPLGFTMHPQIETLFGREETRDGFLDRLRSILQYMRESHRVPIIQVEAHGLFDQEGQAKGFFLASGEVVTWAELKSPLTEINLGCCVNLLVVSGACQGLALAEVIKIDDRTPVWGVLGPTRIVTAGELEDAHFAFYRRLYATRDYGPAIEAMNDAVPAGDRPFFLFGAEWMFRQVMRKFFKRYSTSEAISARVEKAFLRRGPALRAQGVPDDEIIRRRERYRQHLSDQRRHLNLVKPHFFAEDLCSGNATRFSVSYEDVDPAGGQAG